MIEGEHKAFIARPKVRRTIIRVLCLVFILFVSTEVSASDSPSVVLLMEQEGAPFDNGALFRAIEAQLSGLPVSLIRTDPLPYENSSATFEGAAFAALKKHQADMVIWVEENESFQVRFLIPGLNGTGQVFARAIDPKSTLKSSRYDVIAIAVSGMVEGLLGIRKNAPDKAPSTTQKIESKPKSPKADTSTKTTSPAYKTEAAPRRKWLELFAAYSGAYFARGVTGHGATFGLGFFPQDHVVLDISFTQSFSLRKQTDDITLELASRAISVFAAFRLNVKSLEFRFGAAWSVDLRSSSIAIKSNAMEADPDDFRGVHSLSPFVSGAWILNDRIGFFALLGTNIALNETIYKVKKNDVYIPVIDPFLAKLLWQFGLTVRI